MTFEVHPQLVADTTRVTDLPVCRVLLCSDARYPWLILVPRIADLCDLHDLDAGQLVTVMAEVAEASRQLQVLTGATKMNVASLGNQVPQLHLHVIARHEADDAWPGPIWGKHPPLARSDAEREALTAALAKALEAG